MNTIEYNCVTYRPSQFWKLVRALEYDGYSFIIEYMPHTDEIDTTTKITLLCCGKWLASARNPSSFHALGKLVEEIKKAAAE